MLGVVARGARGSHGKTGGRSGGDKSSQGVTREGKVVLLLGSLVRGAKGSQGQTTECLGETRAVKR